MSRDEGQGRISTGVQGLDEILRGGLPGGRTSLVKGRPGAGKTTLAMQFLLEGARRGEPVVYVALSESEEELRQLAPSHGWDLRGLEIVSLHGTEETLGADSQYTFFHPSEIELSETTRTIVTALERIRPRRIVFDSISEIRLLARDALRFRRQILALKQYFAEAGCTVLLVDTADGRSLSGGVDLDTLVHGVVQLEQLSPEYGADRRRLRVVKVRGVEFTGGFHDFKIVPGGLRVFPRLDVAEDPSFEPSEPFVSGVDRLDRLLGGGVDRGSTTMFLGPAGVGKSTISSRFLFAGLERGERGMVLLFDETRGNWKRRAAGLGMDMEPHLEAGNLDLRRIDVSRFSPGEVAHMVRGAVEDDGVAMVLIDSINGYQHSMNHEAQLTLHLHELFRFLDERGVATLVVVAQHGFIGEGVEEPLHISYLADTVVLMRYFEALGKVRKALSVIKKRTGRHEQAIRELLIQPGGIRVGQKLWDFMGVISGELVYRGEREPLFTDEEIEGESTGPNDGAG